MRKKLLFTLLLSASIFTALNAQTQRPDLKPWTQGARQTGQYRNLFAEAGYPQDQIDQKLKDAWYTVFEGPNRVYEEVGEDMAYVSDVKNKDVRTEGMSYGMMLAVQWDKQEMFDRLFTWAITYMRHNDPSKPNYGYYAWSCKTDGTKNSQGAASDGELYYITSLIFASNRWGNDGKFNYKAEAQKILNDTMSKTGEGGIYPFINVDKKLIRFVPEVDRSDYTDPSYHLPAFYEVWAEWADDGRADFWRECAAEARNYLHKAIDPVSGINPDTSEFDGKPTKMWGNMVSEFHYDSWRVPMNIAMDYSWYCKDPQWQSDYANRFQNTLYSYGIDKFPDQFGLDGGKPKFVMGAGGFRVLRHSIGIVGTSAAASLMASDNKGWEFVDEVWNAKLEPYEDGYVDYYYDGIIYLFALMHLSGNYRIIVPNMTKELLVPAISSREEIESKGVKAKIDCCNWSQDYNYTPNAEFFIAHTSDALCVKFLVSEKSVFATCLESNGPVWADSCVECFLKLPESDYYYNFETNCIGVGLSAKQKARGIEESFLTDNITRISSLEKKTIDIEDSSWSLYLEIPSSTLGLDSPPESLLANFYKCGSKTRHYLSWNPITSHKPDFHRPEFFGVLKFLS